MSSRICRLSLAAVIIAFAAQPAATEPQDMTASEAVEAISSGAITSRELIDESIAQAEAGRELNAFITLDAEGARAAADAADAAVAAGETLGPLHGVPVVVKDNIMVAGLPGTGGTPALEDFVPETTAPSIQRLIDAGAIILGKTNLHELAFGITSNNTHFGAVANAYDATRFAGGSSGGTAVAVAKRMAPVGVGTDTGGSARIPAALNGIAGFRPSTGRYPGEGIVPISSTRDTAGPMARTVSDLALMDAIMAGEPVEALQPASLQGLRLGVAAPFTDQLEPETERLFQEALGKLEAAGAVPVPIDASHIFEINERVAFPIALYEVRHDLAAFLEEHGTGVTLEELAGEIASPDVRGVFAQAVLGPDAMPEEVYRAAIDEHRPALRKAYADLFQDHDLDALVFPSTPLPAAPIEGSDETVELLGEEVPTFLTYIRNTDPGSNSAVPGLVVPMGLTAEGLPVGIEFTGPEGSDRDLLALGLAVEEVLGRLPPP
jgi:indoleacetamide hydrolase